METEFEEKIGISFLLPFMNKKYFNYFVYYLPKSIVVVKYEVLIHLGFPKMCIIYFESNDSKKNFVLEYEGKNFPNLN